MNVLETKIFTETNVINDLRGGNVCADATKTASSPETKWKQDGNPGPTRFVYRAWNIRVTTPMRYVVVRRNVSVVTRLWLNGCYGFDTRHSPFYLRSWSAVLWLNETLSIPLCHETRSKGWRKQILENKESIVALVIDLFLCKWNTFFPSREFPKKNPSRLSRSLCWLLLLHEVGCEGGAGYFFV